MSVVAPPRARRADRRAAGRARPWPPATRRGSPPVEERSRTGRVASTSRRRHPSTRPRRPRVRRCTPRKPAHASASPRSRPHRSRCRTRCCSGPATRAARCATCRPGCKQLAWYFARRRPASYGDATTEAVRGFQEQARIPVTGEVDQRTLDRLDAMTAKPTRAGAAQPRQHPRRARPAVPDRPGAVRRQVQPHPALGRRRQGPQRPRRALRRVATPTREGGSRSTTRAATTCPSSTTPRCRSRCSSPAARPCTTRRTSRRSGTPAPRTAASTSATTTASPGCSTRSRSATRSIVYWS